MMYSKYFHVYPKAIPADMCQKIIAEGKELENKAASIRSGLESDDRKSTIAFFDINNPEHTWLTDLCERWVRHANTNYFNFHLNRVESVQFTRYKTDQYYHWHPDMFTDTHIEDRYKGMNRKLSMTLQLSEPNSYEGGDFLLELPNTSPERASERIHVMKEARQQGSIIVFHSYLWHKVAPITKGERFSLVSWYLGRDFV